MLKQINDFILGNLDILFLVVTAMWYIATDLGKVKETTYKYMLLAKQRAKEEMLKNGQAQKEWVVENTYGKLPLWFRGIVSKEKYRKIVQDLYDEAIDLMDDGKLNDSTKGEQG